MRILLATFLFGLGLMATAGPADARVKPAQRMAGTGTCIPSELKRTLDDVEARFGSVRVISAHRPGAKVAGSGRRSKHADCQAVDFTPPSGKYREVAAWLKANHNGGVGTYSCGHSHIHIDTGGNARWHTCSGGRSKIAKSGKSRSKYAKSSTSRSKYAKRGGSSAKYARSSRSASKYASRTRPAAKYAGRSRSSSSYVARAKSNGDHASRNRSAPKYASRHKRNGKRASG